ncbi:NANOG neighbor homeobox-like isoform X2 [Tachyglossus aculeatus]|uniref:NANOG neighbor homeobox-like isoform X2 n=1 Tax=Tachyglossus aculeatus TaxID=9261 RepID=UPI0018F6F35D|nr:NANOG neighbor homeobox-like isoform X2 [Tachyglossus aculeatus]
MEETEAEEKERNATKRKRDKVVVHETPRNRPVSKSITEALWTTFKTKHHVRTAEAVRPAGDLTISVPRVTAWFQSTRRKQQEMAKVQKKATKCTG